MNDPGMFAHFTAKNLWFSSGRGLDSRPHSAVKARQFRALNLHPCHSSSHTPVVLVPRCIRSFPSPTSHPPVAAARTFLANAKKRANRAGDTLASSRKSADFGWLRRRGGRLRLAPPPTQPLGMGSRASHDGGSRLIRRQRKQPDGLPF